MNKTIRFALSALALAAALSAIACGADAASPQDPTAVPTEEWNIQKEYIPTATAQPATPSIEVPPTPAPTNTPAPQESPRVLWMRSSHAGPGVVTIRFETNVPTTAKVMAMTNQVGPAAFFTEDLNALATVHTTSVPASAFGRYKARIEDDQGNVAWAEMRYKTDPQGLDWGTGAAAPTLKAPTAKQLDVTYAFPAGHPTKLGFDGSIYVFMTDAGCTTADASVGDLVGSALNAPATGNAQLEHHKVIASIPGAAFDYQVIVGQPLFEDGATMVFIQLEIRGNQLPKVTLQGPGEINSN